MNNLNFKIVGSGPTGLLLAIALSKKASVAPEVSGCSIEEVIRAMRISLSKTQSPQCLSDSLGEDRNDLIL